MKNMKNPCSQHIHFYRRLNCQFIHKNSSVVWCSSHGQHLHRSLLINDTWIFPKSKIANDYVCKIVTVSEDMFSFSQGATVNSMIGNIKFTCSWPYFHPGAYIASNMVLVWRKHPGRMSIYRHQPGDIPKDSQRNWISQLVLLTFLCAREKAVNTLLSGLPWNGCGLIAWTKMTSYWTCNHHLTQDHSVTY